VSPIGAPCYQHGVRIRSQGSPGAPHSASLPVRFDSRLQGNYAVPSEILQCRRTTGELEMKPEQTIRLKCRTRAKTGIEIDGLTAEIDGKIKRTGVRKLADLLRSRNLCLHIGFEKRDDWRSNDVQQGPGGALQALLRISTRQAMALADFDCKGLRILFDLVRRTATLYDRCSRL
jgi:hypothetical protein